ncbi:methionine gamma-lyase family protein, partial [Klebsiella pneumoniae]|uniref:methionine gamma-lyase family protein n=1 Tax=Klebsiella pneumoniae TaxID=573 RepID=UPI003C6D6C47
MQSIQFNNKNHIITFYQTIQYTSPINSHFTPYTNYIPNYKNNIIITTKTFIQNTNIKLSTNNPIKPPYITYIQNNLTYSHIKITIYST